MGRILAADVAAVRDQVPLDKVIGETVQLSAAGGASWKGLCPFHDERTPSFHVNPTKGFWYCFGCSQGGDAIDFVRRTENLSFTEAVEKLADIAGVPLRYEEGGPSAAEYAQRKRLSQILEDAHRLYVDTFNDLPANHQARRFFTDRDLDGAVVEQFGVGYAPERSAGIAHLTKRGWTSGDLVAAGLCTDRGGLRDLFQGRVVWPIRDPAGKIVAFGGRSLTEGAPKYVNGPETVLYRKSVALFNLHEARRRCAEEGAIIVVEGYTDVMALAASGVQASVATCGTAFSADHAAALRRFADGGDSAGPVTVFFFDGDSAGQTAARRAFNLEPRFARNAYVTVPPGGLDPCDVRLRYGGEHLRALTTDARIPLAEFALQTTIDGFDTSTVEGRAAALDSAVPVLGTMRDDMVRASYETWLAGRVGVEAWRIAKKVREYQRQPAAQQAAPVTPAAAVDGDVPGTATTMPGVEREALKCVLQQPALSAAWYEVVEPEAYTCKEGRELHEAVIGALADDDAGSRSWLDRVCATSGQSSLIGALLLEPLAYAGPEDSVGQHCDASIRLLLESDARRRIGHLRSALSTLAPGSETFTSTYNSLLALEQHRRELAQPPV